VTQRTGFDDMLGRLDPEVEAVAEVSPPHFSGTKWYWRDGQAVDSGEPLVTPGYSLLRARAYPSLGDQLDALWKTAQFEPGSAAHAMQQQVLAVKGQYPKPSD
jgi:hypothetical protein